MKKNNLNCINKERVILPIMFFFILFSFYSVSALQQNFTSWDISNPAKTGSTGDTLHLYRLDESSGTTIYDDTGNYNGLISETYLGSVTVNQEGIKNRSYYFNGGYGTIARIPSGSFAIQLWFNTTDVGMNANRRWFFAGGYGLATGYDNHSFEWYADIWGGSWIIEVNKSINDGNYHQIILQNNGTDFEFYFDNVLINSTTGTFEWWGNTMTLGTYTSQGSEHYRGYFDEVVIWNKALNNTERKNLYNYYQETADATSITGTANPSYPLINAYDNNWSSYAQPDEDTTITLYTNYTKPTDAIGGKFNIKAGDVEFESFNYNLTINTEGGSQDDGTVIKECWEQNPMQFKISAFLDTGTATGFFIYCWKGNSWNRMLYGATSYGDTARIYDDAMWWNVSNVVGYGLSESSYNYALRTGNLLTVTPSRITYSENQTDVNNSFYVQKQYDNLNGNFIHKFTLNVSSISPIELPYPAFIVWSISENIGSSDTFNPTSDLFLYIYKQAENYSMELDNIASSGASQFNMNNLQFNQNYYFTIQRTGDNISINIYEDAERTQEINLLEHLLEPINYDYSAYLEDYNYVGFMTGLIVMNEGYNGNADFYIENFDDGFVYVPAGTSGNIFDFIFNYGREDIPTWVRVLISLAIVIGITVAFGLFKREPSK